MERVSTFAITQTLSAFYHKHNIMKQYCCTYNNYEKALKMIDVIAFEFVAELTPKNHNIHFHGFIRTLDSKDKFILKYKLVTKDLGFSDIKVISSQRQLDGWKEYIYKDVVHTIECLELVRLLKPSEYNKYIKTPVNLSFIKLINYTKYNKYIEMIKLFSHYPNICQKVFEEKSDPLNDPLENLPE